MKAIVHDTYGPPADVLRLEVLDTPAIEDDDVLVRVHAAAANAADWHLVRGEPYFARLSLGLRRPKDRVPGCDLAGRVEAVGANVTTVRTGDEVYGSPFGHGMGAFAEYAAVPADRLAHKPRNLAFDHAAAVPLAASTALQALRDHGRVGPGTRVLVVGASGGVGSFAVQIAKALDAEVTAVCGTRNIELSRSLGADHVIDYTAHDVTRQEQRYDVVLQLAGTRPASDYRRVLAADGTLLMLSGEGRSRWFGPVGRVLRAFAGSPFVSQRTVVFTVAPNRDDLTFLTGLIESGKVAPVIDRTFPLSEVPKAVSYVEQGHTRGKVTIAVAGG